MNFQSHVMCWDMPGSGECEMREQSQGSAGKEKGHAAPNCWEDKGVEGWDETSAAGDVSQTGDHLG